MPGGNLFVPFEYIGDHDGSAFSSIEAFRAATATWTLCLFEDESIPDYLVHRCIKKGLLLFWLLWEKKAVRISPPLTISEKEIIQGCKIICETLDEL